MVTDMEQKNNRMEEMPEMEGFYTLKRYRQQEMEGLTWSMEDYLEMICRMEAEGRPLRVGALAASLHVRPSSASKMLGNLKEKGYIDFQKYGTILVTDKGRQEGGYLLHRHRVLNDFFCLLNGTGDELEQVEKIEHFINRPTVENLERLTVLLAENAGKSWKCPSD